MKLKIVMATLIASLMMFGCGDSSISSTNIELSQKINTVNTHNTAPIGTILPWDNQNVGIRCVRTMDTNMTNMSTERFVAMSVSKQIIMMDMTNRIEWVNGREDTTVEHGCNPVSPGETEAEIEAKSETFCSELVFATHNDWRVPSDVEQQDFMVEMQKVGKVPFYANPSCPRVVGINTGS